MNTSDYNAKIKNTVKVSISLDIVLEMEASSAAGIKMEILRQMDLAFQANSSVKDTYSPWNNTLSRIIGVDDADVKIISKSKFTPLPIPEAKPNSLYRPYQAWKSASWHRAIVLI